MFHRILASTLVCCGASLSARAQCPEWSDEFHPPGVAATNGGSGAVEAAVVFDDGTGPALFVGGTFDLAGDQSASNIAKWDGASWSALGAGTDGRVRALAAYDDGTGAKLYAVGDFTLAGGVAAERIACWDGASWSALGSGLNNDGFAMAVHDDGSGPALFVAGRFSAAGGISSQRIARWNGAWSAVPGALTTGSLRVLEVYDDGSGPKLVAGGSNNWLSAWDGTSWTPIATSFPGIVRDLEVHDDGTGLALYASGNFATIDGVLVNGLGRWDGASWQPVGTGGPENGVLLSFDDGSGPALYSGDADVNSSLSQVSSWTLGGGWQTVGSPFKGFTFGVDAVETFAVFDAGQGPRLHVGGTFAGADTQALWAIAKLENAAWTPVSNDGQGVNGNVYVLEQGDLGAGHRVFAAGEFQLAGTSYARSIAEWDGASWSSFGNGLYGTVHSLAVHDDGSGPKLYAGGLNILGWYPDAIAVWDGSAWQRVGYGVYATLSHSGCFAAASFDDGSGPALYIGGDLRMTQWTIDPTYVVRWNGTQWIPLANQPDGFVYELKVLDDGTGPALYMGGDFTGLNGVAAPYVARWNGVAWSGFGAGPGGAVANVEMHDDGGGPALYASVQRRIAQNDIEWAVSRWSGSAWVDIGTWEHFQPTDLQTWDDGTGPALYASAASSFVQGESRLKVWRNGSWSDVPGVPEDTSSDIVRTLLAHPDGSLWAGGRFRQLGGIPSFEIGRYVPSGSPTCMCDPVSYCTSGTTTNGCVPSIDGIGIATASNTTEFTIQVTSVEGLKSGHLFYGVSGPHAGPWGTSTHFLCVKAPTQRTATQATGGNPGQCDGTLTLDWDAYVASHPFSLGMPFSAGQTVWSQGYFRDPPSPKTTALSDGLSFTLCP